MKRILSIVLTFILVMSSIPAHAGTLIWDYATVGGVPASSTVTLERSAAYTGPFTTVAVIPSLPSTYILPPNSWGFYRITNAGGYSNIVQYSLDVTLDRVVLDRISAMELRLAVLETPVVVVPPVPAVSNFTTRNIDIDRIEIVGNCLSMKTTGTGTTRVITCVH